MEGASFGAGLAGAAVDPVSFAKRPQTLLRVVSWVATVGGGGSLIRDPLGGAARWGSTLGWLTGGGVGGADFRGSLAYRGIPRLGGLLLLNTSPGRYDMLTDRATRLLHAEGGQVPFLGVSLCCAPAPWPLSPGSSPASPRLEPGLTLWRLLLPPLAWPPRGGAHLKALHRFRLGTTMSIFATEQLGTGAGQGLPWLPSGAAGVEGPETYQSPPFTETLDTPKGYQVPAY
uniref:Uncharacterized protein n=1 Tax=Myotis lucifugus TaxID=59463 RepID=G1QAI4_MYOLU